MFSLRRQDQAANDLNPRWSVGVDQRHVMVYVALALIAGFAIGFITARIAFVNGTSDGFAETASEGAKLEVSADAKTDEFHRVTRIIRGDTIEVEGIGPVRMVGVETPDGKTPKEIYGVHGQNAFAYTEKALLGQQVRLEFDPANSARGNKDDKGQTLAYVFTQDGRLFNGEVIKQGHAFVRATEPFQSIDEFRALERDAMQAMRGVWGVSGAPSPATQATTASTQKPGEQTGSDQKSKKLLPLLPSEIGPALPTAPSAAPSGPVVFVSSADHLYHKEGCEYLGKKRQALSLSQARADGRTACSRCFASTVLKAP